MSLYHYTGALLDNVWLEDGFTIHQTKFGTGVSYADLEGLFRAIALELCLSPAQLSPKAVRFLRKRLDISQQALGLELGCSAQAVAKWEKGQTQIPVAAARMLRVLVLAQLAPELAIHAATRPYGAPTPERMLFHYLDDYGWQGETPTLVFLPNGLLPVNSSTRHC